MEVLLERAFSAFFPLYNFFFVYFALDLFNDIKRNILKEDGCPSKINHIKITN